MTGFSFGVILFCLFMATCDKILAIRNPHSERWAWIWLGIALFNWWLV